MAATAAICSTVHAAAIEAAGAIVVRRAEQSVRTAGASNRLPAVRKGPASGDRVREPRPLAGLLGQLKGVLLPLVPIADPNGGHDPKEGPGSALFAPLKGVLPPLVPIADPNGGHDPKESRAGGSPRTPERRPATSGAERRPGTPSSTRRPGTPTGPGSLGDAGQPAAPRSPQPQAASRRIVPRFEPGTAHRDLLFASLASEQRPIAERLAAGGIPAVRRAIAAERERARSEGRPEVTGEAILALAEQLAPSVKQAIWLDRAEAAVEQLPQISLRDLRTTVVAAAPRDEASRDLDRKLREELDRRVKKLRSNWEEQMTHALEEGRVLQALRFSAQPPEPTARFPAALVGRLASSAGAAMSSSTPVERWLAILDAAVSSPIRRQIHPEGLPEDPSGEVVRKARVAAGSLPALAPMLGLSMPPPTEAASISSAASSAAAAPSGVSAALHAPVVPTGTVAKLETTTEVTLTEAPADASLTEPCCPDGQP